MIPSHICVYLGDTQRQRMVKQLQLPLKGRGSGNRRFPEKIEI